MGIALSVPIFFDELVRPSIKQDPGELCTSFVIGKGMVLGGGLLSFGSFLYYCSRLCPQDGVIDHPSFWREDILERVKNSYLYYAGSLVIAAISVTAINLSPTSMEFITRNTKMSISAAIAALIVSGAVVQGMPYERYLGWKHVAWVGHSAILGAVVAPLTIIGGPVLFTASWVTAFVIVETTAIGLFAPRFEFLSFGMLLALCFSFVAVSSVGNMIWPPSSTPGIIMYSINLYGGLLVFSAYVVYHTQGIIGWSVVHEAREREYIFFDPINASISIFLDTMNIFLRIAVLLPESGNNIRDKTSDEIKSRRVCRAKFHSVKEQ